MNALLVEDDPISMMALHGLLEEDADIRVFTASNAEEGARMLTGPLVFDVVVCDVFLGDRCGLELLRMARKSNQLDFTVLVLISSQPSKNIVVQGADLGIEHFFVKPFNLDLIMYQIEQIKRQCSLASDRIVHFLKENECSEFDLIKQSIVDEMHAIQRDGMSHDALEKMKINFYELRIKRCVYMIRKMQENLRIDADELNPLLIQSCQDLKFHIKKYFPHFFYSMR
ncbi:MAG: response regulator [Limnobacter sp.]|nr:response regulator [Limnobacter sp.]